MNLHKILQIIVDLHGIVVNLHVIPSLDHYNPVHIHSGTLGALSGALCYFTSNLADAQIFIAPPRFSATSDSKVPPLDSVFLCSEWDPISQSIYSISSPFYSTFLRSIDGNASSRFGVCGHLSPWSVACEPYCP